MELLESSRYPHFALLEGNFEYYVSVKTGGEAEEFIWFWRFVMLILITMCPDRDFIIE